MPLFLSRPCPSASGLLLGDNLSLLSDLSSRGSRLQGTAAALGFVPNPVGGIKLMALQVKSIQLKLLPSLSSAHFRSHPCSIICSHSFPKFMCLLGPLSTTGCLAQTWGGAGRKGQEPFSPRSALWPRPAVVRGQEELRTQSWNTKFRSSLHQLLTV